MRVTQLRLDSYTALAIHVGSVPDKYTGVFSHIWLQICEETIEKSELFLNSYPLRSKHHDNEMHVLQFSRSIIIYALFWVCLLDRHFECCSFWDMPQNSIEDWVILNWKNT